MTDRLPQDLSSMLSCVVQNPGDVGLLGVLGDYLEDRDDWRHHAVRQMADAPEYTPQERVAFVLTLWRLVMCKRCVGRGRFARILLDGGASADPSAVAGNPIGTCIGHESCDACKGNGFLSKAERSARYEGILRQTMRDHGEQIAAVMRHAIQRAAGTIERQAKLRAITNPED